MPQNHHQSVDSIVPTLRKVNYRVDAISSIGIAAIAISFTFGFFPLLL